MKTTETLYDEHAADWTRDDRLLLSDFTARPRVVAELDPAGTRVLDLGCGEGYVARLVAQAGAVSVLGLDSSVEMIERARRAIPEHARDRLHFQVQDARSLGDASFVDRVMAVFLFNYLTRAEMLTVLQRIRPLLTPGGRLVFTVPHPCFPYMRQLPSASQIGRDLQQQVRFLQQPFYFDTAGHDYFAGVDRTYEGQIWRRDGVAVPVRCVHKTWSDYFEALTRAGFTQMPKVVELHVTDEHLAIDPAFFEPLRGYPLHVLFRVEVP